MEDNKQENKEDIEKEIREEVTKKFTIMKREGLEESIKENKYKAILDAILAGSLAIGAVGLAVSAHKSFPSITELAYIANIPAIGSMIFLKRMIHAIVTRCGDEKDLDLLDDQEYLQSMINFERKNRGL